MTMISMWIHLLALSALPGVLSIQADQVNLPTDKPYEITLQPVDSVQLRLRNIPNNVTHLTIQVHTQWHNVSLTQTSPANPDNSVFGNHVGLVMLMKNRQISAYWNLAVNATGNSSMVVSVRVTLLGSSDPIPGGCNLESPLDNDPNLYSPHYDHQNHVQFSLPNKGPSRRGFVEKCGDSSLSKTLRLELYIMWLPERDRSWSTYNQSLHKMLWVENILKYGTKVRDIDNKGKTAQRFAAYPRQGIAYNIIASDASDTANASMVAQVPMVTYSCDYSNGECSGYDVSALVITHVLAILGTLLCYFGHRWFHIEITAFGALAFQLIGYILLQRFSGLSETSCLWLSLLPAAVGGAIWLAVWLYVGFPVVSILLPGLVTGFIVSSVLFNYTPFGALSWWQGDFNFGMGFLCGMLLPTVILLAFPRILSVASCAVGGSFLLVLAADLWAEGSVRLLLVNMLHKSTVNGFITAMHPLPYQFTDAILIVIWIAMATSGIIIQLYREKGRPHFPPSPWPRLRRQKAEARRADHVAVNSPTERTHDNSERQPLLRGQAAPAYTTTPHASTPPVNI